MVPKWDHQRGYTSKAQHFLCCMLALKPLLRLVAGQDMVQRQGRNQCQITDNYVSWVRVAGEWAAIPARHEHV